VILARGAAYHARARALFPAILWNELSTMDLLLAVAPKPPDFIPPADVVAYVLGGIAVILIAARIVGAVFVKIGQPRIVGEIIAGILIGPTVLGGQLAKGQTATAPAVDGSGLVNDLFPLPSVAFLAVIGQIALVFYMFLVGLELDKRLLKGRALQMAVVGVVATLVPVGLGFLAGSVLDGPTWRPAGITITTFGLFLGAAISVTAFPVMARILQEKGLLGSEMGAIGVGSAAIVTVLMFLVIALASGSAKGSGVVDSIGVRLLLLAGVILVLGAVVRPIMGIILRRFEASTGIADTHLAILLIGALATGLATDRIIGAGLVGGFLFGLAVPDREGLARSVIDRMESTVILFLLPIFLAVSGLRTDLTLVNGTLLGAAAFFLVLMIVGKVAAGYLAGRAVGLGNKDAQVIGVLLNCRGLLILVVGLIGLQLGTITPSMQVVFVVGAIVTTMMTGPLISWLVPTKDVERITASYRPQDILEAKNTAEGTSRIAG
jgi:Kef-type K+ transport system membrane component KefB